MSNGALQTTRWTVPANGQTDAYVSGDYFRVTNLDGGAITIRTDNGDALILREGEGARVTKEYRTLRLVNDGATNLAVTLVTGKGYYVSARTVGEVSISPAGSLVAVGAIAGGGTIPANAVRTRLVMKADPANAGALTVAGIPLDPGDTWDVGVTGTVAVGGAATDTLHVAEVV